MRRSALHLPKPCSRSSRTERVPLFPDSLTAPAYTLQRSRRRTIAIHVHDDSVDVRAPLRMAKRDIDAFVEEKTPWIIKKLAELRERQLDVVCVNAGSSIAVMGELLQVCWQPATRGLVRREGDVLFICGRALDEQRARRLFLRWLLEMASIHLLPLAETRIADMQLTRYLGGFSLRYTRSLWGRCSASGNILFNPLILLAPLSVIDYLVVHEACHLHHMNHSREFWALVESHCPDWQHSRRWLKEHGHRLQVG
jgi:predicted metal-dependent hydrolase